VNARRTHLVTVIEDEADHAVTVQLAAIGAPKLTDRETVLVLLAIRAGIGAALNTVTKEGAQ
jgi:hypothetical protein